ncbi:hypothetical protein AN477_16980 [Alicyclobacillus ferrooxydans]|uniref:Uncharacterized protein n=1 Tax=Alicyclobacillus ferrooxydans TaxID=471514 RepID=A0A0P9CZK7_9BACL|nr:hypothetical protein AN477_16980 [Alicyclobacillus ferrooxydans]
MTNIITYDNQFNANEWFVIVALFLGLFVTFKLPSRFSRKLSALYFLCGISFGAFFDLTLGTIPRSFYDIGDSSTYQFVDFLSLLMYGPFSYLFFYLYDFLKLNLKLSPLYILSWTLLSLGTEWLGVQLGVFHYHYGYGLQISFVIYLIVHSLWVLFFYLMKLADTTG